MVKETLMTSRNEQTMSAKADINVECVKCECCGLTEECTALYIKEVKLINHGRWICGLCSEAVKDELERSCSDSEEEALDRHMRFCKKFRSSVGSPPENTTEELICAVKQLLIKSLESPRASLSEVEDSRCGSSSSLVGQSDDCCFRLDE